MEVITWFIFMGWTIIYFVKYPAWDPIIFLGLSIGISLCCVSNAIKELKSPWHDIKKMFERKEEK